MPVKRKKRRKLFWPATSQSAARSQGWDIFHCDDPDHSEYELMALDDPRGVAEEDEKKYAGPTFEGPNRDRQAAEHVKTLAKKGDKHARRAIRFLIAAKSKDVDTFNLRDGLQ